MCKFIQDLQVIQGFVLPEEKLCLHTTWRIGGPAEVLVIPATQEDVLNAIRIATLHSKPITVIGNGSNLLVADSGVRGLVLKLSGGLKSYSFEGNTLRAEAGCLLPGLARTSVALGLSGLEFAAGIPASLGGALLMNAGAHGGELGNLVQDVLACKLDGEVISISSERCNFGYRQSTFQQGEYIILSANLRLQPGDKAESLVKIKDNLERRKNSQPLDFPNAGSIFRNPPGVPAGKLIEEAGAKGLQVGGALVSEKHANFIVNTGGATAADVLAVINSVQEMVWQKFNILLHPEVRKLGCFRE
ncbi:MAG TPA: UDP-N-acetylmuramate dehydrogenase [Candidatus Deferrimicrobium sp.]|nr:UDP-N-acetylmuramate dehydrogenase [Candidatus Deferrimicrobium sp.]